MTKLKHKRSKLHTFSVFLVSMMLVSNILSADDKVDKNAISDIPQAIPIKFAVAVYPRIAIRHHIEGFVTYEFNVDSQGRPQNLRVLESKPEGTFERSVKLALKKWRFKPSVKTKVQYTFEFKLDNF